MVKIELWVVQRDSRTEENRFPIDPRSTSSFAL